MDYWSLWFEVRQDGKVLLGHVMNFLWYRLGGIHYGAAKVLELAIGAAEGDGVGKSIIA